MSRVAPGVLAAVRFQRDATVTSPLYRSLLDAVVHDCEADGPCAAVLVHVDPQLEPVADAVPLRFLGGVHGLVLTGKAPELAARYPSVGGSFDPDAGPGDLAERLRSVVAANQGELIDSLEHAVQTNEVGRCAALVVGFLDVAARFGLPLRVLELGSSAGLNLGWDRYRYEGGRDDTAWGDPLSPLRFEGVYVEPRPRLDVDAVVVERRGCDRNPIDATSEDGALALRSFVWADQVERFVLLDGAIAIAPSVDATVDRADAADWLEAHLAERNEGVATVVFQSIVWQYLSPGSRQRVVAAFDGAGRRATPAEPLAWLRLEPGADPTRSAELRMTTWPGEERLLARAGYHVGPVRCVDPTPH